MHFHSKTVSALPALLVGAGLAGTTFAAEPNLVSASVTAGVKQSDNRDLIDSGDKEDQTSWYVAPTIRIRREIVDLLHLDASYSPVWTRYDNCRPGQEEEKWEHTVRLNLDYAFSPLTSVGLRENYWWSGQKDYFYGDDDEYDPARDDRKNNDYYQNRFEGFLVQKLAENGDYVKVGGRWRVKRYDEKALSKTNDEDEWGAYGEFMHVFSRTFSFGVFADYTGWDRESEPEFDLGVDYLTVGFKAICDLSGDGNHLLEARVGYNHAWYESDDLDDQDLIGDSQVELKLFQQTDTQLFAGVRYGRTFANVYPFSSQEDLAGYASVRQYFGEDRRFSLGASVELRTRTYDAEDDLDPSAASYGYLQALKAANGGKSEYDRDSVFVRVSARFALTEHFGIGAFYTYEDIDSDVGSSYKENVFGLNGTVTLF